ncbi:putative T7SS-secreted protein [Lacisediminihabitans sp.]|uniref:putative T7SS-secreted protein n=1 Tax=Lacisediminihabitans sp. TaxID=2787631 RepID=UPI002F934F3F
MSDTEYQPLSGNESLLRSKASQYGEIANAIIRSVNTLNKLSEVGEMKSEAIDALRDKIGSVAKDINKARDRYAGTSSALVTYSYALKSAQDDANTAISAINQREGELSAAARASRAADDGVQTATDSDADEAKKAADQADHASQTARGNLEAAQRAWHSALESKNDAATVAIAGIQEVVDGSKSHDLNDGWWDDWGSKVLDVVKVICEIAGFLAIFLAWVPILGAILVGLAILGALITLVESIVKLVNGEGSFSDVLFAAVGVVLAAFGGKFAAYLAKLVRVQAATKVMTKGSNFLKSGAFKTIFGETKTAMKAGKLKGFFTSPQLGNMVKEVRNPFSLKLGTGTKFTERYASGFMKEGGDFLRNPLGIKLLSKELSGGVLGIADNTAAKVGLMVLDGRSVLGKVDKLYNTADDYLGNGEHQLTIKPDTVLKDASNSVESVIRNAVGAGLPR